MKNVKPTNKDKLMQVIADTIEKHGPDCNLNFIDTSLITDMDHLFYDSQFNGDISKWDVSSVKTKRDMFFCCPIKPEYKPKGL